MADTDKIAQSANTQVAELSSEAIAVIEEQLNVQERALTPRQAAFVREYLLDFNGTQAAIRAGYSVATAGNTVPHLLGNAGVAAAIARGKAELTSRHTLKQDIMIRELACLALSSVAHYNISDEGVVTLAEGAPPNAMSAIQSIDKSVAEKTDPKTGEITRVYNVKLKLWDKPNPLKLLGKYAGITAFSDRVEITGKDGGPIEFAAVRLADLPIEQLRAKMLQLVDQAPVEGEIVEQAS